MWLSTTSQLVTPSRLPAVHSPCMLINWPSFNAAPRIFPKVATSRLTLASLMKTLPCPPPPVDRLKDSDAAPIESDAARAESSKHDHFLQTSSVTHSHSETNDRFLMKGLWTLAV
jgi:hypothetical protein